MKKIILVFSVILFSLSTFANTDLNTIMSRDTTHKMGKMKMGKKKDHKMGMMHKDGVMMKDGKMMMMKDGKMMAMENEVTLDNGTKVMTDGTCMDKSGKSMKMKDGDHLDMSGKMMPMKKHKMRN